MNWNDRQIAAVGRIEQLRFRSLGGWTLGLVAAVSIKSPGVLNDPVIHAVPNRAFIERLAWQLS